MRDRCFICGLASYNFEREDVSKAVLGSLQLVLINLRFPIQGFDEHIHGHHSMWNYIYYYVYLDSINPRDHTAIEKQVHTQVKVHVLEYVSCLRMEKYVLWQAGPIVSVTGAVLQAVENAVSLIP